MPETRGAISNTRIERGPTPELLRNAEIVGKARGTMPMPGFEERNPSTDRKAGRLPYTDLTAEIQRSRFRTGLYRLHDYVHSLQHAVSFQMDSRDITFDDTPTGVIVYANDEPTDTVQLTEMFDAQEREMREAMLNNLYAQIAMLQREQEELEKEYRKKQEAARTDGEQGKDRDASGNDEPQSREQAPDNANKREEAR